MKQATDIKILVLCEESQTVLKEFRDRGFDAWSCDIQDPSHPDTYYHQYHIKGDALDVLQREHWDAVIAFPPCTYLSNAGAQLMYSKHSDYTISGRGVVQARYDKAMEAKQFFTAILNCAARYVMVENPKPLRVVDLPKYTQIIQPYEYGHNYSKMTMLWLRGLPLLIPTHSKMQDKYPSYTAMYRNPKKRSTFHTGIARAIASQYGQYILSTINKQKEQPCL